MVVGGPHVASDGRSETREESEIGMMMLCRSRVCGLFSSNPNVRLSALICNCCARLQMDESGHRY